MQASAKRIRFLWDFHGPQAEGTARHFEKHLCEFLASHQLSMPTGVREQEDGTWLAFCEPRDLPEALGAEQGSTAPGIADQIGAALRPRAFEWVEHA